MHRKIESPMRSHPTRRRSKAFGASSSRSPRWTLRVLAAFWLVAGAADPAHAGECLDDFNLVVSGVARAPRGNDTPLVFLELDTIWRGPRHPGIAISGAELTLGTRYIIESTSFPPSFCEEAAMMGFIQLDECSRVEVYSPEKAESLGAPRWTDAPNAFRRGEVNGDGAVDVSDAVLVLLHLFQGRALTECEDVADVDDDGAIRLNDAVYGLNYLFRNGPQPPTPGPVTPGFDATTDDPFLCGDQATFECEATSESTLPGVRLEIVDGPCQLTLADAASGVLFTYRVVSDVDRQDVVARSLATCRTQGPSGFHVLERISGDDPALSYCLCDLGKCKFSEDRIDVSPGSDNATFLWCGREWFGPSDTSFRPGDFFPPGTYTFELRAEGTWTDDDGTDQPYEMRASYEFELVR